MNTPSREEMNYDLLEWAGFSICESVDNFNVHSYRWIGPRGETFPPYSKRAVSPLTFLNPPLNYFSDLNAIRELEKEIEKEGLNIKYIIEVFKILWKGSTLPEEDPDINIRSVAWCARNAEAEVLAEAMWRTLFGKEGDANGYRQ